MQMLFWTNQTNASTNLERNTKLQKNDVAPFDGYLTPPDYFFACTRSFEERDICNKNLDKDLKAPVVLPPSQSITPLVTSAGVGFLVGVLTVIFSQHH